MGKVYIIRGKLSRLIDYREHSENLYAVNISTFTVYYVHVTLGDGDVVFSIIIT